MHNKSCRDDNQVVGIYVLFSVSTYHRLNFLVSEVLATPKSLPGFKANNIIIAHAA